MVEVRQFARREKVVDVPHARTRPSLLGAVHERERAAVAPPHRAFSSPPAVKNSSRETRSAGPARNACVGSGGVAGPHHECLRRSHRKYVCDTTTTGETTECVGLVIPWILSRRTLRCRLAPTFPMLILRCQSFGSFDGIRRYCFGKSKRTGAGSSGSEP